jgi:hypothetical protein
MDVPDMPRREVFVSHMVLRSSNAALRDVPTHGATKVHKRCGHEGCTNQSRKGEFAGRMALRELKYCNHEGFISYAKKGGGR